jgi:hypothetical protein
MRKQAAVLQCRWTNRQVVGRSAVMRTLCQPPICHWNDAFGLSRNLFSKSR